MEMFNRTVPTEINVPYFAVEIFCAVVTVIENLLVIIVFARSRRLRKITYYYVISLAMADLLVGLIGIPSALVTYVGLPGNFRLCIFMNSILMLLCTSSILSLISITVDRYWAIIHPLTYMRDMTERKAVYVIITCWITAGLLGLLPCMGWNKGLPEKPRCFFMEVMDFKYLAFLYFATMVGPSIFMAFVYGLIYSVVKKQVSQMSDQVQMCSLHNSQSNGSIVTQQKSSEARAARNFSVIVLLFVISWLPLYTINTVVCFCPNCHIPANLIDCCIVLSHLNSMWNPVLYAWAMREFREALLNQWQEIKEFILCVRRRERRQSQISMQNARISARTHHTCIEKLTPPDD